MPEPMPRRPDLRASVPTLEPDDAFLARLSALAVSGAPAPVTARPIGTWRLALAATGVAAVLVGVAWLAGLSPSGSPNPAPPPATTPPASEHTPSALPQLNDATSTEPALAPPETVTPPSSPTAPDASGPDGTPAFAGQGNSQGNGHVSGQGHQTDDAQPPRRGPDEHAGEHPNEHATTKSKHGNHSGVRNSHGQDQSEEHSQGQGQGQGPGGRSD